MKPMVITRRIAIGAMAAAPFAEAAAPAGQPSFCIFSKHMAQFSYDELGKKGKEVGFDGVDLTVRAKGHVEPARAAEGLPKAAAAIRGHGLTIPMITTGLLKADEPAARPTLATAAKLKIPFWKPGYYRYTKLDSAGGVERALSEVKPQIAGLAALSKEHGLTCGFHNHSGDYFGTTVWDTRAAIEGLDTQAIGYYFDPAHATIEGGLAGWRISMNLVAPRLKMVGLKDFYWAKSKEGKWKTQWCPMGEGMVDWPKVFSSLKASGFSGPLTLHVEYETKDELEAIARDYQFVRRQLSIAWES